MSVAILFARGRRFGALQWLPAVIFLAILYASYAARYEEAYWYPYDLPHMLIFGAACLCFLEGPLWMFFPLFVLDLPMRETSVFLIVVAVPVSCAAMETAQGNARACRDDGFVARGPPGDNEGLRLERIGDRVQADIKFEESCASPALAADGQRFGFSADTGIPGSRSAAGSLQMVSLLDVALPVGDCLVRNAHREPYFSGMEYAHRLSREPGDDELYLFQDPYGYEATSLAEERSAFGGVI